MNAISKEAIHSMGPVVLGWDLNLLCGVMIGLWLLARHFDLAPWSVIVLGELGWWINLSVFAYPENRVIFGGDLELAFLLIWELELPSIQRVALMLEVIASGLILWSIRNLL